MLEIFLPEATSARHACRGSAVSPGRPSDRALFAEDQEDPDRRPFASRSSMHISAVQAAGGKVSLRVEGDTVFVVGEIDQLSPRDFMAGFLEIVHNMVLGERLSEVKVNVTQLGFLNSSGIKEFLSWILRRNRIPPERKYKINFLFDPTIAWQPITLPRLRDLDPGGILLTAQPQQMVMQASR
jgi:hypothetical protein